MRGGLGIDALGDNDVCKARVARGGLEETLRSNVLVGVVGDEMELLVVRGGDREGLLEQTIGPVDRLCRAGGGGVWRVIELTVCQEAACDSARAPGFAVRPASHASLTLVKAVDGAGPDRLTLNVGQATMDSRDDSQVASFKDDECIVGGLDETEVSLHRVGIHCWMMVWGERWNGGSSWGWGVKKERKKKGRGKAVIEEKKREGECR